MNKRQSKKNKVKVSIFESCYVWGYRNLKRLNREYHEFCIASKHYAKAHEDSWVFDAW